MATPGRTGDRRQWRLSKARNSRLSHLSGRQAERTEPSGDAAPIAVTQATAVAEMGLAPAIPGAAERGTRPSDGRAVAAVGRFRDNQDRRRAIRRPGARAVHDAPAAVPNPPGLAPDRMQDRPAAQRMRRTPCGPRLNWFRRPGSSTRVHGPRMPTLRPGRRNAAPVGTSLLKHGLHRLVTPTR